MKGVQENEAFEKKGMRCAGSHIDSDGHLYSSVRSLFHRCYVIFGNRICGRNQLRIG